MYAALQGSDNLWKGINICENCQIHKETFNEINFVLKGLRVVISDGSRTPYYIRAKLEQLIHETYQTDVPMISIKFNYN
jgi:hypothetical protein